MEKLIIVCVLTSFLITPVLTSEYKNEETEYISFNTSSKPSYEFERINNTSGIVDKGFGVKDSFKLDLGNHTSTDVIIEEDEEWAENWIENNPDLYGGPGHNYSSGMILLLVGEKLKQKHLYYDEQNEVFEARLEESDRYHVVIHNTALPQPAYKDESGECHIIHNLTGYDDLFTEKESYQDCINPLNFTTIFFYFLLLTIGITTSYLSYNYIRKKLLVHKLSGITDNLKNSSTIRENQARIASKAYDSINKKNYTEASKLVDDLEQSLDK